MKTTEQLRQQIAEENVSPAAFEVFGKVLLAMDEHQLEATDTSINGGTIEIEWFSTFNQGNTVTMFINEDGTILCIAMGSIVKIWSIENFTMSHSSLHLSMAETLEYIRHFIWANHNV